MRGVQHVPGSFVSFIVATVRPPVALLAPVGVVLAWRFLGWRALLVPLGLFAAGVITFVGTGLLGLSILPRYLTVPAIALCLFAGYALLGFTESGNRVWARASAAAAVLGLIGLIILAPSITNVREEIRFIRLTHDSLIATLDDPAVREGMALRHADLPDLPARPGRALARRRADRRALGHAAPDRHRGLRARARRRCGATASRRARRRGSTCRVLATRPSRGTAF